MLRVIAKSISYSAFFVNTILSKQNSLFTRYGPEKIYPNTLKLFATYKTFPGGRISVLTWSCL